MNLFELMCARRSVRRFTEEPVAEGDLDTLVKAGMLAPNGKNLKPWHFVVVTDPDTLQALRDCRAGRAAMLETAKAAIVVLGDESRTDTCVEDCSAALTSMHLMAFSLGLGSCWLQCRLRPSNREGISAEDYVRRTLGVPQGYLVLGLLAVGHPEAAPAPHDPAALPLDQVHRERW